jgi:hypothetical protein
MPGFFGFTAYASTTGWLKTKIVDETYLLMITVVLSVLTGALLKDKISHRRYKARYDLKIREPKAAFYLLFFSLTAFVSLVFLYYTSNGAVFTASKSDSMELLNRWHIIFFTVIMVGLPLALAVRSKIYFSIFLVFQIINLLIGFRFSFVIAGLACLIIYFEEKGPIRLIKYHKYMLLLLVFSFLMFFYKYVGYAIKFGLWDVVLNNITNYETYANMIMRSEPFVVLNNLNQTFISNYTTSPKHIFDSLYQFILFAPEMGANISSFQAQLQGDLFSNVDYGIASNIWAQFWSSTSWMGVLVFIMIYVFLLAKMSLLGNRINIVEHSLWSSFFVYIAFYLHRNEFSLLISAGKRFFFIVIVAFLLYRLIRKRKNKLENVLSESM